MTPFFGKRCFLTWVKKWVLLTVFWKAVFSWKHYFYSVFSKTQLFKNKNCMLKKTENLWKIVGCFWAWQMVSFGFGFFEVLILKRFVFGVSGIVSKVLKMLVFQVFWAFMGWLIIVHLGLEGLGVFVFLVFVFLCCVAFASVLFALLLVLIFVLFFLFCFFL